MKNIVTKKEVIKQFLSLDWRKVLLLAILIIPSILVIHPGIDCLARGGGCSHIYGFPFAIHSTTYPPFTSTNITVSYNPSSIALNIIFWYLVSCLIIFIYNKFKTKK